MLSMSSQSASDGSYTLHIVFEDGTDLDKALALVQNRVGLARAAIPPLVLREGISVRKRSPQPLVLVSLSSPDNRFADLYLGNYAIVQIKDELGRLPGVADVVLFGRQGCRLRVLLDADKLAALEMSAADVVAAISQQNIEVASAANGQPPVPKEQQLSLTINTLGRLIDPQQFGEIIVKADVLKGRTVRLNDVARIRLSGDESGMVSGNGKPTVLLGVYPVPGVKPRDVSRAVHDKLADLRAKLPEGLALAVPFDFASNLEDSNNAATPEHLVIDAQLPDSASIERTAAALDRASELLRKLPGVQEVLALTEHPFSLVRNRPCIIVRCAEE